MADQAEKDLEALLAQGMSLDEIIKELETAQAPDKVRPPMAGPQPGPYRERYRLPEQALVEAKMRPQMASPSKPDPAPMQPPTVGQKMAAALDPSDLLAGARDTLGAVGSGFNRMLTGGAYAALTDRLGLTAPEQRAEWERKSPAGKIVGETLGMAPLVASGGGVASALASRGGAAAAQGLGKRLATAALDTAVPEAATSAIEGNDLGETGRRAAVGGAVGIGGQAVGEGLKLTGKALSFLDPWVARYQKAKDKGIYKRPDMKALEGGEEGVQKAAEEGRDRILARDVELNREAGQAFGEATDPLMGKVADPAPMRKALMELSLANRTSSGEPLKKGAVQKRIKEIMDTLGPEPTVEDLVKVRRSLDEGRAAQSLNPTDEQVLNREIYAAIKDSIPEMKEADKAYAIAMDRSRRTKDIISNKEANVVDAEGEGRVTTEKAMARNVGRVGDTTRPGLEMRAHLEELANQDPEFAAALDFVANKKAKEAVGFGFSTPVQSKFTEVAKLFGLGPLIQQNARAALSTASTAAKGAGGAAVTAGRASRPAAPFVLDPMDEAQEKRRKKAKEKKQ